MTRDLGGLYFYRQRVKRLSPQLSVNLCRFLASSIVAENMLPLSSLILWLKNLIGVQKLNNKGRLRSVTVIQLVIIATTVYSSSMLTQMPTASSFTNYIFEKAMASSDYPTTISSNDEVLPLEILNIRVSDPDHRDMSLNEIKAENPLSPFMIEIPIIAKASDIEAQQFTLIMDVRDQDGVTIDINLFDQTYSQIQSIGQVSNTNIEWELSLSGKYNIRFMALSDLQNPQILSPVAQKEIIVVGNSHCDTSLWDHVYNPSRLQIVHECIGVTGIASFISTNANDGDEHVGIRPDPEFAHLVSEENKERHNGAILGEVICYSKPVKPAPQQACTGYENSVTIPPRYSYIRMTGTYVLDKQHNLWGEMHPITSIVVIERSE